MQNPHNPGTGPTLSVVMAVRDVADWLTDTVQSIRDQSFTDLEVIVVDDGSTDKTLEILAGFDDPRIRVYHASGRGGAAARNQGIALARGEYLTFADGDDIVPQHAYDRLIGQARHTGAEMVVGNYITFSPTTAWSRQSNLPLYGEVRQGLALRDAPEFIRDRVCWNRVVKRSSWQALGLGFADSRRSNDIRVITDTYCFFEFDVVPDAVYAYRKRVGHSSMTAARTEPGPLSEHLRQELGCAASVRRYGDDEVTKVYFDGILTHDLWHHLTPVLAPEETAAERYAEVRRLVSDLVSAAPQAAVAGLGPLRRFAYGLIRAGAWDLAAIAAQGDSAAIRALLELHGPDAVVAAAKAYVPDPGGALAALLRKAYVEPIKEASWGRDLSDAEVTALARGAGALLASGAPAGRLSAQELAVANAPVASGVDAVRGRLAEAAGLPAVVEPPAPTSGVLLKERLRKLARRRPG